MKLKRLEKNKYKIIIIGTFIVISIVTSYLLGKTFSLYQVNKSFEFVNGKVNYYGHSDVYFAFYSGSTWLEEMPKKGNNENLDFDKAECDNNTTIEWDEEKWSPIVLNLTKAKTRCTLYFAKKIHLDRDISLAQAGTDGLYAVEHNSLSELSSSWNKTEYRYAGKNPNNYVRFNNELWRIIGLVNVETASGVKQRVKIIRKDGISGQKDFGDYAWDKDSDYINNWTTSKLKDMLNGIYYNSGTGTCYTPSQSTCDFSGNDTTYPKGLDATARNMVDSEVIWNIGGSISYDDVTVGMFYERERGISTYLNVWTNVNDETYHKGIGIMYPSDYGYATHGGTTGRESCFKEALNKWNNSNYRTDCVNNNWLKPSETYSSNSNYAFRIGSGGAVNTLIVNYARAILPVVYLKSSVKITDGKGTTSSPYILSL